MDHQPRSINVHTRLCDLLQHGRVLCQYLAKGLAPNSTLTHELQAALPHADWLSVSVCECVSV